MANSAVYSYGGNEKRKIGHSKFDMGFEHIMSSNFGALHPVACYETLPDDYWDISQNTVTLLKPLTAPAYTRINQNFYGAYVRNQQVWKHWNDYISNGTAYGDVYGSNTTNQNMQNRWKVPSISAPYIQQILKIGNGFACPVFIFDSSAWIDGDSKLQGDDIARLFMSIVQIRNWSSGTPYDVTDAMHLLINSVKNFDDIGDFKFKSVFKDVYFHCEALCESASEDYPSGKWHFTFTVGCSYRQMLELATSLSLSLSSANSKIGSNVNPVFDVTADHAATIHAYRFFCDEASPECKTSLSPFILNKVAFADVSSSDRERFNTYDYKKRIVSNDVTLLAAQNRSIPDLESTSHTAYCHNYISLKSPFWGSKCAIVTFSLDGTNNHTYVCKDIVTKKDYANDAFEWFIEAKYFGFDDLDSPDNYDAIADYVLSSTEWLGVPTGDEWRCLDQFYYTPVPQQAFYYGRDGDVFLASSFGKRLSKPSIFESDCPCDTRIVFPFSNPDVANLLQYEFAQWYPSCSSSKSIGYNLDGMCYYLCNNSSRLLDDLGIKVDPLSARSFVSYRYEEINALPFLAYSKIWNDHFRNKAVSNPELDYRSVNGEFLLDEYMILYIFNTNFRQPSVIPPKFRDKSSSDFSPNSWDIEFNYSPRNGLDRYTEEGHFNVMDRNWFHLLTGCCMMEEVVNFLGNTILGSSSASFTLNDFFVPNYYNGLLHLKYQNFNKDYFTSALLDPMSGANQVEVGDTINELRVHEAEQHWWERTAVYRSVKKFFQGTYGVTPIEEPLEARITGSDHVNVQIGEVIQTSGSTPESPQGTRTGLGGAHGKGTLVHGHANEHGFIFILCSHTVESQYLQAFDKMWDVKESFLDYPTVDFASIGNESILQKEINYTTVPSVLFDFGDAVIGQGYASVSPYAKSSVRYDGRTNPALINLHNSTNSWSKQAVFNISNAAGTSLNNVFGYIPRYSSYKQKFDQVSGQYRHELNFWHTFKRYLAMPILCHEFVNWELAADDDDINRIFAASDDSIDDKFCIDCFINASVDRALPFVCVPSTK